MNRDDKLLGEAYGQMTEGIFDRINARSAGRQSVRDAGGKTGFGGMVQKAKQGVIKGLGGQLTSTDQKQNNANNIAQSKGQINNITASYMQQIKQLAEKYSSDIQQLGVDVSLIEDDEVRNIIKAIIAYSPKA